MYLRTSDYDPAIQDANLQQIISLNGAIRLTAELRSKEEIESYLIGKYNTEREFTDTNPFALAAVYLGGSRCELNFAAYDPTKTYTAASKTIVVNAGIAYIIAIDTPAPAGIFDAAKWTVLGNQYDIYSLGFPYDEFDYYGHYNIGDVVFYKNKIYKCLQPSGAITHFTAFNAVQQNNIPPTNVFPDDTLSGASVWGVGVAYSVTNAIPNATYPAYAAGSYAAGVRCTFNGLVWQSLINSNTAAPATDINKWFPIIWNLGDNRSQRLVEIMVDIVLMKLHQRIAPRNIPELRQKNYELALEWLVNSNHGNITPNLSLKQPLQGNRISFGGNTKAINIY